MKYLMISVLLSLSNILFANIQDNEDPVNYSRSGEYFPYVLLTDDDSLSYPITYEIELYVNDLYDLDINNNFFTTIYFFYSKGVIFPLICIEF